MYVNVVYFGHNNEFKAAQQDTRPDWHWSVEWCLNDWGVPHSAWTLSIRVVSNVQSLVLNSLNLCILKLQH